MVSRGLKASLYFVVDVYGGDGSVAANQIAYELTFAIFELPQLDLSIATARGKVLSALVVLDGVDLAFVAIELANGLGDQRHRVELGLEVDHLAPEVDSFVLHF